MGKHITALQVNTQTSTPNTDTEFQRKIKLDLVEAQIILSINICAGYDLESNRFPLDFPSRKKGQHHFTLCKLEIEICSRWQSLVLCHLHSLHREAGSSAAFPLVELQRMEKK